MQVKEVLQPLHCLTGTDKSLPHTKNIKEVPPIVCTLGLPATKIKLPNTTPFPCMRLNTSGKTVSSMMLLHIPLTNIKPCRLRTSFNFKVTPSSEAFVTPTPTWEWPQRTLQQARQPCLNRRTYLEGSTETLSASPLHCRAPALDLLVRLPAGPRGLASAVPPEDPQRTQTSTCLGSTHHPGHVTSRHQTTRATKQLQNTTNIFSGLV